MATFTGQLKSNEIFAGLYNMIISQQVFADNFSHNMSDLVDMARVDGSLYGDTKLYYSVDALHSKEWGADAEANNLLKLYRPGDPECQAITLDTFRQISLTVDDYLSKRAWGTEGAFSSFNSIMLGMIRETKKIYDATTYNVFIGTTKSPVATENIEIDVTTATTGLTGEEAARVEGQVIAEGIAKIMSRLKDYSRDYNDYGNLRAYSIDDLVFVFNEDLIAKIEKRDLPTIYHDQIVDQMGKNSLPAKYFGTINTEQKTGDGTIRSAVEQTVTKASSPDVDVFAGELIPSGYTVAANKSYTNNDKILCKIYHKGPNSVPYMSAFEVGTSFFNPKSLTENHYLTWGHNTLEYLKNYPFITVTIK